MVRYSLSVIQLDRSPFSIQFNGKKYDSEHFQAIQIAVVSSQATVFRARIGQKTEAIHYFEPGTGMAQNNNMYNTMIVSNLAHHYIHYESEQDKKAHLVSQKKMIYAWSGK